MGDFGSFGDDLDSPPFLLCRDGLLPLDRCDEVEDVDFDDNNDDCGNGTIDDARRTDTAIKYGKITGMAIESKSRTPRCRFLRRRESLDCFANDSSSKDTRFVVNDRRSFCCCVCSCAFLGAPLFE